MEEHHDIEVNYIEGDDVTQDIAKNPNITTEILAQMAQITSMTIKRHIAKLPHIQYVGSGYSGHWEIKK